MEEKIEIPEVVGKYCIHKGLQSVEVICPYCGQKHYHSWTDVKPLYPAYRVSHCGLPNMAREGGTYYIKQVTGH